MIVRKAEERDLPFILELFAQSDMDGGHVLSVVEAKKIFQKMKTYPDYYSYVAELDGHIVGTFSLAIMDNIAHMGSKSGLIEDVVVLSKLQGQGIGKQMIRYAIDLCKKNSCYKACLSSNLKRHNAHMFYRSIGFKIHGYSFLMETKESQNSMF